MAKAIAGIAPAEAEVRMGSYRAVLQLTPTVRWQRRILDSRFLPESLPGVGAHKVATDQWGNVTLEVTLTRADRQAVLNDLLSLAQQLGYSLINGEISDLVGFGIQGAVVAGLGGGAAGATSNSVLAALISSAVWALAGWIVGSSLRRVEAVYEVRPTPLGQWTLTPRAQQGGSLDPGGAWG